MQDFERFNIHILLFLNRVTVPNLLISDQHYAYNLPKRAIFDLSSSICSLIGRWSKPAPDGIL